MPNVYITGIPRSSSGGHLVLKADIGPFTSVDVARFWAKVARRESGCWEWTASRAGGGFRRWYGQFATAHPDGTPRKRLTRYAHRVSWLIANGSIPEDAHVLHKCDNPICVNPAHLFLGNQDINMKDAAAKGRLSVPRPRRQKVSQADISEMFALRASGLKLVQIADRFNVSKSYVSFVLSGKRRVYTAPQLDQRGSTVRQVAS